MDIKQLHSAVQAAFSRREFASCFSMLDQFLETATGENRGHALRLKANVILNEPRRAPEGLALSDEALELLRDDPEHSLRCLTTSLALCITMGDVDKARLYEGLVHQLLQQHAGHPGVARMQFRPFINLGVLANIRGQHPTAYWHFIHSVSSLENPDIPEEESSCFLLIAHLHIANTCLAMNRVPEAAEALERARILVSSKADLGRWTVYRARLLRAQKRFYEALASLESVTDHAEWHPEDQARFHLELALVAQDLGDMRRFHAQLATAHQIAAVNSIEFLLCEIQRTQRAPIFVEVMK